MPEQITKYPDVALRVLKAQVPCAVKEPPRSS